MQQHSSCGCSCQQLATGGFAPSIHSFHQLLTEPGSSCKQAGKWLESNQMGAVSSSFPNYCLLLTWNIKPMVETSYDLSPQLARWSSTSMHADMYSIYSHMYWAHSQSFPAQRRRAASKMPSSSSQWQAGGQTDWWVGR